jgi:hypothetical protein
MNCEPRIPVFYTYSKKLGRHDHDHIIHSNTISGRISMKKPSRSDIMKVMDEKKPLMLVSLVLYCSCVLL